MSARRSTARGEEAESGVWADAKIVPLAGAARKPMKLHERLDAVAALRDLRGPAKSVLFQLARRADEDTLESWPSVDRLAADSGLGRTAVNSALRSLIAAGVIEIVTQSPGRTSNVYRLNLAPQPYASRTAREANNHRETTINRPRDDRQPFARRPRTVIEQIRTLSLRGGARTTRLPEDWRPSAEDWSDRFQRWATTRVRPGNWANS